jgi:hypothetical protein
VPLGQIAKSASRCAEFDRALLPTKASVGTRWKPRLACTRWGAYFVLDGNHRVSVARFHGVEWIDADVTEFRAPSGSPSLLEPTRPRTIEETKEHTMPNKPPGREDPKQRQNAALAEAIETRWGLREDETRIAELMELNGMRRALAFEERFIVAEKGGKVMAALRYRTEPKRRLLLGPLVSDPWAEERPLAVALYAGCGELARKLGVGEVRARSVLRANDYPYEAGYRWRLAGGWFLDTTRPLCRRKGLPADAWRRMVALLGVPPCRSSAPSVEPGGKRTGRRDRGRDDFPLSATERPKMQGHPNGLCER